MRSGSALHAVSALTYAHCEQSAAAALTIPSALTLLVNVFPEPTEQARAIGVFGGCGAIGNGERSSSPFVHCRGTQRADYDATGAGTALGLIIGAVFVQYASWSWVFWFVALVCMPIASLCVFLIPKQEPRLAAREIGRAHV